MARVVRMPPVQELPEGTVRDFVSLLFHLYRSARRPPLREISDAIRTDDSLRGTASTETIRRMLRGTAVPAHWETVEAVYLTLCKLASLNPEGSLSFRGEAYTIHRWVEKLWHSALDNPDGVNPQPSRRVKDPWDDDDQEPPF